MFTPGGPTAMIGVVHLLPLPGSPCDAQPLSEVIARACADAVALAHGGAAGAIVENLGDAPFTGGTVRPATVAAMTRIVLEIQRRVPELPLGINVLRNDAAAALAVAAATQARFIRVNVHAGTMLTDQGPIVGRARATLLERNRLGASVAIAADVLVKHAVPIGQPELADVARDTFRRAHADALIVSGAGTGQPTDAARVMEVIGAVPEAPVWVGSGVTPSNIPPRETAAAIVGTWLHHDSDLTRPVSLKRVRAMARALDQAANSDS
ncbi:MAG: membrane complex biogenesis BtpA family protein [Myxococcota bacterium]|jgi:membrane complex biogenesis BtpA family protein